MPYQVKTMVDSREKKAIRTAARQVVRYQEYMKAVAASARLARREYGERREGHLFAKANPKPKSPEPPKGMSWNKFSHSETYEAYREELTTWNAGHQEANRDKRGAGKKERRDGGFPEKSGGDVLNRYLASNGRKNDTREWCRLASLAIELSGEKRFAAKCGRPRIPSELAKEKNHA